MIQGRPWSDLLDREEGRAALARLLPDWMAGRRWFGGKAKPLRHVRIVDVVPWRAIVEGADLEARLALVEVSYREGDAETYVLPLLAGDAEDVFIDATADRAFRLSLLETIAEGRRHRGASLEVVGEPAPALGRLLAGGVPEPAPMRAEQSNTSIVFGDRFVLKVFRRLEEGVNPDLEITRFLAERTEFRHVPPYLGRLEIRAGRSAPRSLAILQGFVPNRGDAWSFTLEALDRYLEAALDGTAEERPPPTAGSLLDLAAIEPPEGAAAAIGAYLDSARLLGRRTAEMHLALASCDDDPAFAPERFSPPYQRALYRSMRDLCLASFALLREKAGTVPEAARERAARVAALERRALAAFRSVIGRRIASLRIRTHGDFHLGQVLETGNDFTIMDFEGEPARSIDERRIKRTPLRDVAGMLRSIHYAAYAALFAKTAQGVVPPDRTADIEAAIRLWHRWVSAAYLGGYLATAAGAPIVPAEREETDLLLGISLLEKAVYELAYELNNRPDWVRIPLEGILSLLDPGAGAEA